MAEQLRLSLRDLRCGEAGGAFKGNKRRLPIGEAPLISRPLDPNQCSARPEMGFINYRVQPHRKFGYALGAEYWEAEMKGMTFAATALLSLLVGAPAYAHHSHEIFDNENVVTLSGTVSEFGWRFPHGALILDTVGPQGEHVPWTLEMGSPRQLERYGWTNHALMAGEAISVIIYPKRDGTNGGAVLAVEFPSGVLMVDEEYWDYVDQFRVRRNTRDAD